MPCGTATVAGWDRRARARRLHRVRGNRRFLIFPWVRVHNRASKTLSILLRRLPADWQPHHGYRPWLDRTRGRGRQTPPKEVFVWPLVPDCQARLRDGDEATRTPPTPGSQLSTPGFLDLWGTLADALATVCEDTERRWQRTMPGHQVPFLAHAPQFPYLRRPAGSRTLTCACLRRIPADPSCKSRAGFGVWIAVEGLGRFHGLAASICLQDVGPVSPSATDLSNSYIVSLLSRVLYTTVTSGGSSSFNFSKISSRSSSSVFHLQGCPPPCRRVPRVGGDRSWTGLPRVPKCQNFRLVTHKGRVNSG